MHHLPVHRNCGMCCLLLQDAQDPDDALVHSACLKMGQLSPWPCRCQARSGRAGCTCCGFGCDCVHASASVPSAEAHQVWGGTVPEDLSAATHSVEHMSKMQDGLRLHSGTAKRAPVWFHCSIFTALLNCWQSRHCVHIPLHVSRFP